MEFRHLKTFAILADELHFGRAARRLHTSQPVVSRTLRDMEEELGVRLLDRSARRVELTRAGRSFLASAHEALRHMEAAVRAAQASSGNGIDHLSLGVMMGASQPIVGRMVAAFRRANPAATVDIVAVAERTVGQALVERWVDAIVGWDDAIPSAFNTMTVAQIPLDVLLPQTHPLAAKATIALADLANEPLIVPDKRAHPAVYERFRAKLLESGIEPDFAVNVEDTAQMIAMIAGGAAIAIAPWIEGLTLPGIVQRPQDPPYVIGFDLAWSQMTPTVKTLTEAVATFTES
ncbi:MAG: LysR substrate-binding domain-containing protein [Pseudomonadota bacterium]